MDVTLDANVYLSDPWMEGIAFKSLLDYLRKTQSKLIVPKLVFDEVLARYPERLLTQVKRPQVKPSRSEVWCSLRK